MEGRRPRGERIPNANSPRRLLRLIGFVATGVRRPTALAEVLEVELRTVHYYTQAAEWLGLMEGGADLQLTARGLALAYADPDTQRELYAEAVWAQPVAAAMLGGQPKLPDIETIAEVIRSREPTLAVSTARRRASAVRGLLAPAVLRKPSARKARGDQLALPFPTPSPSTAPEPVDLRAGAAESPDVYRRFLVALLDHGELGTGQVRALLDTMGADEAPLGAYVEMASRRGDAVRVEERLVVTAGAAARRDVVEDPVLVALTDPLYREYLACLEASVAALQRTSAGQATAEDGALRARLTSQARRFASWDLRIFGRRLQPGQVDDAVRGLLLGRRLQGMPVAGDLGEPHPVTEGDFLANLEVEGLAICFPRALVELTGGVAVVNPACAESARLQRGFSTPSPVERRFRVHGGLLSPGEPMPRAVPDNLSLRLRALAHVPVLSLLAALLLAGRRGAGRPVVHKAERRDTPSVRLHGEDRGTLLALLERFASDQGWRVSRPPCDGLADSDLTELAVDLGIATSAAGRVLLDEGLFLRLQEDPECRLVYDALLPLEDRLMAWLVGP